MKYKYEKSEKSIAITAKIPEKLISQVVNKYAEKMAISLAADLGSVSTIHTERLLIFDEAMLDQ